MSVVLEVDSEGQRTLEAAFGSALHRTALESLVAEGCRTGKLSRRQAQRLLGFADIWETEKWMKGHGVFGQTVDDVVADAEKSARARGA